MDNGKRGYKNRGYERFYCMTHTSYMPISSDVCGAVYVALTAMQAAVCALLWPAIELAAVQSHTCLSHWVVMGKVIFGS